MGLSLSIIKLKKNQNFLIIAEIQTKLNENINSSFENSYLDQIDIANKIILSRCYLNANRK